MISTASGDEYFAILTSTSFRFSVKSSKLFKTAAR
ncbi:MerR family transcriptional regulator [Listeria monocytogenes]|nr:MerR family transcriptional regulator [Listeria monocytogenes]